MREPPSETTIVAWIKKILEVPEYIYTMELIQLKEVINCINKYERKHDISPFRSRLHIDKLYFTKILINEQIATLQGKGRWTLPKEESNSKDELKNPILKTSGKQPPSKYYALLHWIKIEMGKEQNFDKDRNGNFSKTQIQNYASGNYPVKSPQSFYRAFLDIAESNEKSTIATEFGAGFKQVITELSGNDPDVIHHLKKYPD